MKQPVGCPLPSVPRCPEYCLCDTLAEFDPYCEFRNSTNDTCGNCQEKPACKKLAFVEPLCGCALELREDEELNAEQPHCPKEFKAFCSENETCDCERLADVDPNCENRRDDDTCGCEVPCMVKGVTEPPCGCEVLLVEDNDFNARQPHCEKQHDLVCPADCSCEVLAHSDPTCENRDTRFDTCSCEPLLPCLMKRVEQLECGCELEWIEDTEFNAKQPHCEQAFDPICNRKCDCRILERTDPNCTSRGDSDTCDCHHEHALPIDQPPPCMMKGVVVPLCGCDVQWVEDEVFNARQPHCDKQYSAMCTAECSCEELAATDPDCKSREESSTCNCEKQIRPPGSRPSIPNPTTEEATDSRAELPPVPQPARVPPSSERPRTGSDATTVPQEPLVLPNCSKATPCVAKGVVVPLCGCEIQWLEDEEHSKSFPCCEKQFNAVCAEECNCSELQEADPNCEKREESDSCNNCNDDRPAVSQRPAGAGQPPVTPVVEVPPPPQIPPPAVSQRPAGAGRPPVTPPVEVPPPPQLPPTISRRPADAGRR